MVEDLCFVTCGNQTQKKIGSSLVKTIHDYFAKEKRQMINLIVRVLLHAADLSNPVRVFDISKQVI